MDDEQRISIVPAMWTHGLLLIGVLLVFLGTLFAVPPGAKVVIVIGMGLYAVGAGLAMLWLVHTRPGVFTLPAPPRRTQTSAPGVSTRDVQALRDELTQRLASLETAVSGLADKAEQAQKPPARPRARRR